MAVIRPLLLLALTACAPVPDLGPASTPDPEAAFPALLPIAPLLAQADGIAISPQVTASLTSRLTALQARASRLRGPVIDAPTRARMRTAIR